MNAILKWFREFGNPKKVSSYIAVQYLLADAEYYANIGHKDISRQLMRVAQEKIENQLINEN